MSGGGIPRYIRRASPVNARDLALKSFKFSAPSIESRFGLPEPVKPAAPRFKDPLSAYRAAPPQHKLKFLKVAVEHPRLPESQAVLAQMWRDENKGDASGFSLPRAAKYASEILLQDFKPAPGLGGKLAGGAGDVIKTVLAADKRAYDNQLKVPQAQLKVAGLNATIPSTVAGPPTLHSSAKGGLEVLNQYGRVPHAVLGATQEQVNSVKAGKFSPVDLLKAQAKGVFEGAYHNKEYGGGKILNSVGVPKSVAGPLGFVLLDLPADPLSWVSGGAAGAARGSSRLAVEKLLASPEARKAYLEAAIAEGNNQSAKAVKVQQSIDARLRDVKAGFDQRADQAVAKAQAKAMREGTKFTKAQEADTRAIFDRHFANRAEAITQRELSLHGLGGLGETVRSPVGRNAGKSLLSTPLARDAAARAERVSYLRTTGPTNATTLTFMGKPLSSQLRRDPLGIDLSAQEQFAKAQMDHAIGTGSFGNFDGVATALGRHGKAAVPKQIGAYLDQLGGRNVTQPAEVYAQRTDLVGKAAKQAEAFRAATKTLQEHTVARKVLSGKKLNRDEAEVASKFTREQLQAKVLSKTQFKQARDAQAAGKKYFRLHQKELKQLERHHQELFQGFLAQRDMVRHVGGQRIATVRPAEIDPYSWEKVKFTQAQRSSDAAWGRRSADYQSNQIARNVPTRQFEDFQHAIEHGNVFAQQTIPAELKPLAAEVEQKVGLRGWDRKLAAMRGPEHKGGALTADEVASKAAHVRQKMSQFWYVANVERNSDFAAAVAKLPKEEQKLAWKVRNAGEQNRQAIMGHVSGRVVSRENRGLIDSLSGQSELLAAADKAGRVLSDKEERAARLASGKSVEELRKIMAFYEHGYYRAQGEVEGTIIEVLPNGEARFMPHDAPAGFRPILIKHSDIVGRNGKVMPLDNLTARINQVTKRNNADPIFDKLDALPYSQRLDVLDQAVAERLLLENPSWAGPRGLVADVQNRLGLAYSQLLAAGYPVPHRFGYSPHLDVSHVNELARAEHIRGKVRAYARSAFRKDQFKLGDGSRPQGFPASPSVEVIEAQDRTRFGQSSLQADVAGFFNARSREGTATQKAREVNLNAPINSPERYLGVSVNMPLVLNSYLRSTEYLLAEARHVERVLDRFGEALQGIDKWVAPELTPRVAEKMSDLAAQHARDLTELRAAKSAEISAFARIKTVAEMPRVDRVKLAALNYKYLEKLRAWDDLERNINDWVGENRFGNGPAVDMSVPFGAADGGAVGFADDVSKLTADQFALLHGDSVDPQSLETFIRANPASADEVQAWLESELAAAEKEYYDFLMSHPKFDQAQFDVTGESVLKDLSDAVLAKQNGERKMQQWENLGWPSSRHIKTDELLALGKTQAAIDVGDSVAVGELADALEHVAKLRTAFVRAHNNFKLHAALDSHPGTPGLTNAFIGFMDETDKFASQMMDRLSPVYRDALDAGPISLRDQLEAESQMAKLGLIKSEDLMAGAVEHSPAAFENLNKLLLDQFEGSFASLAEELRLAGKSPVELQKLHDRIFSGTMAVSSLLGEYLKANGQLAETLFNLSLPSDGQFAVFGRHVNLSPQGRGEFGGALRDANKALAAQRQGFSPAKLEGVETIGNENVAELARQIENLRKIQKELGGGDLKNPKVAKRGIDWTRPNWNYPGDNIVQAYSEATKKLGRAMDQKEFDRFLAFSHGTSRTFVIKTKDGFHREATTAEVRRALNDGPKTMVRWERRGTDVELKEADSGIREAKGKVTIAQKEFDRALAAVRKIVVPGRNDVAWEQFNHQMLKWEISFQRRLSPGERSELMISLRDQLLKLDPDDIPLAAKATKQGKAFAAAAAAHVEAVHDLEFAKDFYRMLDKQVLKTHIKPSYVSRKERFEMVPNESGVVPSEGMKPPMVQENVGGLGGGQLYSIESPIFQMLLKAPELEAFQKPNAWRTVFHSWKWAVTMPNPAFWTRNFVGDSMNSALAQGGYSYLMNQRRAYRAAKYVHLYEQRARYLNSGSTVGHVTSKEQRKVIKLEQKMGKLGSKYFALNDRTPIGRARSFGRMMFGTDPTYGGMSIADIAHYAIEDAVANTGYAGREVTETMHGGGDFWSRRAYTGSRKQAATLKLQQVTKSNVGSGRKYMTHSALNSGTGGVIGRIEAWRQFAENVPRINTYIGMLEQSAGSRMLASRTVAKHHFDYGDLSKTEKAIRNNLMPFYTWNFRNMPLWIGALAHKPGFIANYKMAQQEAAWVAGLPDDWQSKLSITQQLAMPFPLKWGGKTYMVSMGAAGLPISAIGIGPMAFLSKLINGGFSGAGEVAGDLRDWMLGQVNPFVKTPTELATNYSFYLHSQIETDYRQLVPAPKWARDLPQVIKQATGFQDRYYDKTGQLKNSPGWSPRAEYLIRSVSIPWTSILYKMSKDNVDMNGKTNKTFDVLSFTTGLRINETNPVSVEYRAAVKMRAELNKQRNILTLTRNPKNNQRVLSSNPTVELKQIDLQLKGLNKVIKDYEKKLGYNSDQVDSGSVKSNIPGMPKMPKMSQPSGGIIQPAAPGRSGGGIGGSTYSGSDYGGGVGGSTYGGSNYAQ